MKKAYIIPMVTEEMMDMEQYICAGSPELNDEGSTEGQLGKDDFDDFDVDIWE